MADRTSTWNEADFAAPDAERVARDEDTVRRGFWRKARRFAARVPFAEDLLAAYYCAFDRETPMQVKAALLGALFERDGRVPPMAFLPGHNHFTEVLHLNAIDDVLGRQLVAFVEQHAAPVAAGAPAGAASG